jgi:predicted nucleotide-binding protein
MATVEEVREALAAAGCACVERVINDNQVQLLPEQYDAVVNLWLSTGTCQVQGHDQTEVESILGNLVGKQRRGRRGLGVPIQVGRPRPAAATQVKKVFVVYGHDIAARTEADAMLRRWGLEPLILDQLASAGNTIIEKLEYYQQDVEWAIVLLTPDDLGHPALDPTKVAPRPRQNVVLEMGMLLGKLGRKHVAMLYRRSDPSMELPSDIQGYIYLPFETSVEETGQALAKEMSATGFYDVPVKNI